MAKKMSSGLTAALILAGAIVFVGIIWGAVGTGEDKQSITTSEESSKQEEQKPQGKIEIKSHSVETKYIKLTTDDIVNGMLAARLARSPLSNPTPAPCSYTSSPTSFEKLINRNWLKKDWDRKVIFKSIIGEVINNTNQPVTFIKIIATFYNTSNEIIGNEWGYGENCHIPLQPHFHTPFKLNIYLIENPANYKLDVTWD